jgi:23S rRNA pseudouridine1911/1915/1917 synthase
MARYEFQVKSAFHRRRLDEVLFDRFRLLSKAYLRSVLKSEGCEVNGLIANGGQRVLENDFIEIEVDESRTAGMKPEEIPLDVLYEDGSVLVIDKPAGILVHPTHFERNGTILNAMTHYLNMDRDESSEFVRPHLIHRLDKETSGVLVAAKDQRSSRTLCSHFKRGHIEKRYTAIVGGVVESDTGEIDLPIDRNAEKKVWQVMEGGKLSVTRFRVIDRSATSTLLELEPVTGRTNQLRIHCAAIGHPILGDDSQGGREFRRLCLHASKTVFWHPEGGKRITVESEADFIEDFYNTEKGAGVAE